MSDKAPVMKDDKIQYILSSDQLDRELHVEHFLEALIRSYDFMEEFETIYNVDLKYTDGVCDRESSVVTQMTRQQYYEENVIKRVNDAQLAFLNKSIDKRIKFTIEIMEDGPKEENKS